MLELRSGLAAALVPLFALQADSGSGLPWYVWVVIILLVLLILFIAFVAGQSPGPTIPEGGIKPEPMVEQPAAEMAARQAEVAVPEAPAVEVAAEAATEVEAAMPEAPPEPDDLKRIEGIGPKVSSLLNEAGIYTFDGLAKADVDNLNDILRKASLRMINPSSWAEQATLAASGKWDELEKLQDELKGGRRE